MQVAIAGAGISGLAAAIALAKQDHTVTVHEQSVRLEPVGAGLQLGPNAVRALEHLGVWATLKDLCVAPACIRICDAQTGHELSVLKLGNAFTNRFGAPYRVAHRADLLQALSTTANGCENISLEYGCHITGLTDDESHQLKFSNGNISQAELIIAADGIRSRLRNHIAPNATLRPSGQTLYRAMAPAGSLPDGLDPEAVYLWLAPGAHVVHYLVSGGKRLNMVVAIDEQSDMAGWNSLARLETILAALPRITSILQDVLATPASWLAWMGADLEPFQGWSSKNAVLLGDAAHATLPYLAQGAAMSLEDAVTLAECLKGNDSIQSTLARFEALRQPRTARIIEQSRKHGRMYHMNKPQTFARNAIMKIMPASWQLQRLDWIYSDT